MMINGNKEKVVEVGPLLYIFLFVLTQSIFKCWLKYLDNITSQFKDFVKLRLKTNLYFY